MVESTPTPQPQPLTAEDELARRRELANERSRRHRARYASPQPQPYPDAAARSPSPSSSSSSSSAPLPVHATRRLESIGSTPEDYTKLPPHVDAPPQAVDPAAAADAAAGAKQVAWAVAWVFKMALQDAANRYQLGDAIVAQFPGMDPAAIPGVLTAAVVHVQECTERVALKYGLGVVLPYQDELTSLGAVAFSAAYLGAKWSGKLDAFDAARKAAAPPAAVKRAAPPDEDDDEDSLTDADGVLKFRRKA